MYCTVFSNKQDSRAIQLLESKIYLIALQYVQKCFEM